MGFLLYATAGGSFGCSLTTKGIAASGQNVGMMAEAIEQCSSELFVAKHLDPLRERQIGGDDGRAAFIALGQQVEQQLAASALEGNKPQLIHDQKCDFL